MVLKYNPFEDLTEQLEDHHREEFKKNNLKLNGVEENQIKDFRNYMKSHQPSNELFKLDGPLVLHQPVGHRYVLDFDPSNFNILLHYEQLNPEPFFLSTTDYRQYFPAVFEEGTLLEFTKSIVSGYSEILSQEPDSFTQKELSLDQMLVSDILGNIVKEEINDRGIFTISAISQYEDKMPNMPYNSQRISKYQIN